jgi:monoamine oxidase
MLDIAVIGAGLAGLVTAYRLQQAGFAVELFEARERLGGRIFTANVQGHAAELGAQNILDGDKAENLFRLIAELDLELEYSSRKFARSYFNGQQFVEDRDFPQEREALREKLERLKRSKRSMREVLEALFGQDRGLIHTYSCMLAGYEGASVDKLSSYYVETLYYMLIGGFSAAHQAEGRDDFVIEHAWIKGGNSHLIEKLSNIVKVHKNRALRALKRDASGKFELTFILGEAVQKDIVILANPCPTFKRIDFAIGTIPEKRLAQIRATTYGSNAKILFPIAEPGENKIRCMTERFITFPAVENHLMNIYYINEAGRFDPTTIQTTFDGDLPLLERVYKMPNRHVAYAREEAFASYEGPVGISWINEPFSEGSYSCVGVGCDALFTEVTELAGVPFKRLFQPIDNRLFFVGEHTSILSRCPGTMEAACESAERTSRFISSRVKQEK